MRQIKIMQEEPYKELGDLYGLFFEDINHAADGGLYAELIQNRSFEFCEIDRKDYHALTAWEKSEGIVWEVRDISPLNDENTHYLHVEARPGGFVRNLGYNSGIYVEAGKKYDFSVYARLADDSGSKEVQISVMTDAGEIHARESFSICGGQWRKYQIVLEASKTTWEGRLVLAFLEEGTYELDMVSLFPQDTFHGRPGGLRRDIAEALEQMHPRFLRFPGGCLVHDGALDDKARNSMYRWKRTIGKVEERPAWRNNWGYNQTLGLGYYEYFCFCEDIGAKPLPVLPGGFNPHKGEGVSLSEIEPWVQDALDLIEFANGGTDTKWGALRKELGHERPFHLEYIGIGNEEIGEGFFERYPYFHRAIREKYPEIKIINTAGPFATGEGYDAGWASARENDSDLVDEHYYSSPEWFLANMHHYEDYDDKGPKIFLGEYASWGNTYYNALVEAAYMTHLERSKAVALACYAPMLCNVDYVNWKPDMLLFDNHRILKTPNYYVQKLFMCHQGSQAVRFEMRGFEEAVSLVEDTDITGQITVEGNQVEGLIWDVRIQEFGRGQKTEAGDIAVLEDGIQKSGRERNAEAGDIAIKEDGQIHLLADVQSGHYKLSFRFRRTKGRKGLKICFGRKDKDNTLLWEFGGWDNWDCNITSICNGRGSTISHRIFHVEEKEYALELEVDGRHIVTKVNGEVYNDTIQGVPQLEDLYATASTEASGKKTYLKAVNLTGEEKEVEILLEGKERNSAAVSVLRDRALTAVNTFEEPDCVAPVEEVWPVHGNRLVYTFAPHSVTVFSFE